MIRFITGRSGSGKSETVTREVCDLINNTGREVVVIVPEQETVVWERKFAGLLKPSSNLRLEVTNFTNLARSVFREYGGLADSVIDDGSRILIMWSAICWADGNIYASNEYKGLEIMDRVGGGDSFASGLIFGLMETGDAQTAVNYGAAHGALAMTTPGDTTMASRKEVEAVMAGSGARVKR